MIVVWYKRDLRVTDHLPLWLAARHGAVCPLYIVEPSLLAQPAAGTRHFLFVRSTLRELRERLQALGQPLVVRVGEAAEVFAALHRQHPIQAVYCHEETGTAHTFTRDNVVRLWAFRQGIRWVEVASGGVVRRLPTRDIWSDLWEKRMAAPPLPAPVGLLPVAVPPGPLPMPDDLALASDGLQTMQQGGESVAQHTLRSFLYQRGRSYHRQMSSPVTAFDACSRLSPHLAWGTISLRQAMAALRARQAQVATAPPGSPEAGWRLSLEAFESRLHWRDHFIQKLEDAPDLDQRSLVSAYDGLRDNPERDPAARARLTAWREGRTGYPLVDACMRALRATGYLNFRMRAMVVSFASHDLWLDWRQTGLVLARWFTDYEPGIHWAQMQMQSGTNGNATLRLYNPTRQAQQYDPDGVFIRRWVPELRDVPTAFISAPHLMPQALWGSLGLAYPAPIVEHEDAARQAKAAIAEVRRMPDAIAQARQAQARHASRRRQPPRRQQPRRAAQAALFPPTEDPGT
jgi:deoxyribodipyrimidine photo-lyase